MISTEAFMEIRAMRRLGHSIRKIARDTGLHRKTVSNYLANNAFPAYHREKKTPTVLEPYTKIIRDYLERTITIDTHNRSQPPKIYLKARA